MKNTLLAAMALVCLFACKKSSTTNNPAQTNSLLASIRIYTPASANLLIDTFVYDANQRLVRYGDANFDTVGTTLYTDSGSYYFTYTGSSSLPSSYLLLYLESVNPGQSFPENETHNLVYDNQNRLIKDTLAANRVPANDPDSGFWYTYSGTTIAIAGGGIGTINLLDSFYLNGSGNLTSWVEYSDPVLTSTPTITTFKSFSTYANPAYNPATVYSAGVFIIEHDWGGVDAISRNLAADNIAKFNTDNAGRVTSTIGTDGTITTYTYNK